MCKIRAVQYGSTVLGHSGFQPSVALHFNTIVLDRSWSVSTNRCETTWLGSPPPLHTSCCADHSQQRGHTLSYMIAVVLRGCTDCRRAAYSHYCACVSLCTSMYISDRPEDTQIRVPYLWFDITLRNSKCSFEVINGVFNLSFRFWYLQNRTLLK
jgi:hypothetical protein